MRRRRRGCRTVGLLADDGDSVRGDQPDPARAGREREVARRCTASGPVAVSPLTSSVNVVATSCTAPPESARPSNRTGDAVTVGEVVTVVIPSSVRAARSGPAALALTTRRRGPCKRCRRRPCERLEHCRIDIALTRIEHGLAGRVVERDIGPPRSTADSPWVNSTVAAGLVVVVFFADVSDDSDVPPLEHAASARARTVARVAGMIPGRTRIERTECQVAGR